MVFEAKSKKTGRSIHLRKDQPIVFLLFHRRKLLLFFHEVRNHAVAAKGVVLVVNVLHHLPVGDWIKALTHIPPVSFEKAVAQKRHHCLAHGLLLGRVLANALQLPAVLPCDYAQHLYAKLLYPVFFNNFPNAVPCHFSTLLYTRTHVPPEL